MKKLIPLTLLLLATTACTRIETGEVGVRIGMDKQVQTGELQPGSFNQTVVGDVMTFPIKDVQVDVNDLSPLASDNSTIQDFDMAVIYSINPSSVADIYIKKNRAFHYYDEKSGDTYLLFNYVHQLGRNAAYKVARKYESLKMADNRAQMEQEIRDEIVTQLVAEKLATSVNISQVLVRNVKPAQSIVDSANSLVQAQNVQKQKEVEVKTATLEAERQRALSQNAGQSIAYMNAEATKTIAQAVLEGKVNTIIIPNDFKGIVNVK